MTDQHRATPEQEINELIAVTVYGPDGGDTPSVASAWEVAKLISGLTARVEALWEEMRYRTDTLAAADGDTTSLIFKVTNRIEALEAAQLEQAESHRFCTDAIVRRVEALEAAQHAHADVSHLSDAEREQAAQDLASPAAWRPLDIETTYVTNGVYTNAAQILRASMVVEGTFDHGGETYRYKANATPERDPAMAELHAASAEAQPGGLVEPGITRRELARIWNDNQDPNEESGDAMARLYSAGFHAGMKWQAHLAEQGAAPAAEAQPGASEIFPVEYADANGEGIRIIMEPADETGRVCWVVRNSRRVNPIHEFPTPEAAYAAHQARAEDEGNRG